MKCKICEKPRTPCSCGWLQDLSGNYYCPECAIKACEEHEHPVLVARDSTATDLLAVELTSEDWNAVRSALRHRIEQAPNLVGELAKILLVIDAQLDEKKG